MSSESGAGAPAADEHAPDGPIPFTARFSELAGIPVAFRPGHEALFPPLARYVDAVATLKDGGFVTCADLTAVDYLRHRERALPAAVEPERFEVVANLLSHEHRQRVRVRVQIAESDLACPTLFDLYPGVENMEREVYDLFGIRFVGHPDMTRILMPEEWEGHPLRKDYGIGRVPVQFKDAPGPR